MSELTIDGKVFVLEEPNALHLVRLLAVVGRVGTKAEKVAANLGKDLLSQLIPNGEEGEKTTSDISSSLFPFLAALTPDDLLELMAALLQFDNEQEGVRWLRKHPPKLNDVIQVVMMTLENIGGITEALANFTTVIGGLNLAGMLTKTAENAGPEGEDTTAG